MIMSFKLTLKRAFLLLCAVVLLAQVGPLPAAQANTGAPYLFYYDDLAQNIVIQRADGTNRFVFGDIVMPADTNVIDGPGWSESGQWFAWAASRQDKWGSYVRRAYVASARGQLVIEPAIAELDFVTMYWLGDTLLISGLIGTPLFPEEWTDAAYETPTEVTYRAFLLNFNAPAPVSVYEAKVSLATKNLVGSQTRLLPPDQAGIYRLALYDYATENQYSLFWALNLAEQTGRALTAEEAETFRVDDTWPGGETSEEQTFVSPDGQNSIRMDSDPLLITNTASGKITEVEWNSRRYLTGPYGEAIWSEDSNWILLFEEGLVAGGGYMRYTGVVGKDGSFRAELGYTAGYSTLSLSWLPPQVDTSLFPAGETARQAPATSTEINTGSWSSLLIWDAATNQIAAADDFYADYPPGVFRVWSVESGQEVGQPLENVSATQTIGWVNGQATIVERTLSPLGPDQALPVVYGQTADGTLRVQLNQTADGTLMAEVVTVADNKVLASTPIISQFRRSLALSNDGRFFAACGADTPCRIFEVATGNLYATLPQFALGIAFSPDSQSFAGAVGTKIKIWTLASLP
jgi:WD40 repeat protein